MRAFASAAAWLGVGCACAVLALWAVGRVCGDRWLLTQYLHWMPTILVIAAAITGLVISRLATRRASPTRRDEKGSIRRWRLAAWAGIIGATLHVALVEWRWFERGDPGVPREERLRVVFWNCSQRTPNFEPAIIAQQPDIAVMLPGSGVTFGRLQQAFGADADFVYHGFAVMSTYKIKRWAMIGLKIAPGKGLDPRLENFKARHVDPGKAMFLQIETKEKLGKDLIVWLVDLPSDLSLSRSDIAKEARRAIDDFIEGRAERWLQSNWARTDGENAAYAKPDLILGDLNTPRGSPSLKTLTSGLRNAYDLAGGGYAATYPRAWPLWHLDQAYAAPTVHVAGYEIIDPGAGTHRMQRIDIATAPSSP